MIKDQFDTLYREGAESGRVMCLSLHPHNLGRPNAAKYLDEALRYILGHLERWQPASLEVCALFDKRTRRMADIPIRYIGFELADEFVVGYGLDYHQRYRNLPFLAKLRPERYRPDPTAS